MASTVDVQLTMMDSGYYAVMFVAFLYICMNPFIYAVKFDPVKRALLRLVPCRKDEQPVHSVEQATTRTVTRRNVQEHYV